MVRSVQGKVKTVGCFFTAVKLFAGDLHSYPGKLSLSYGEALMVKKKGARAKWLLAWGSVSGLGGMALALWALWAMYAQMRSHSSVVALQDGNGVCYSRVLQSFAAKMMGEGRSKYLDPDFIQMTGQCYGDMVDNFYHQFTGSVPDLEEKINRLSSQAHWFHEKLRTPIIDLSGKGGGLSVLLQNQFAKIEGLSNAVGELLTSQRRLFFQRFTFFVGVMLISLLLLAAALLKHWAGDSSRRVWSREMGGVEPQLRQAVESEQRPVVRSEKLSSNQGAAAVPRPQQVEYQGPASLQRICAVRLIEQVLSQLRKRVLEHNIHVDIHLPPELMIWTDSEALLQVIYSLLSAQVRALAMAGQQKPAMAIRGENLGAAVVLSFTTQGGPGPRLQLVLTQAGEDQSTRSLQRIVRGTKRELLQRSGA